MGYGGPPRPWCPWFMPLSFLACFAVFVFTMYFNNCPENTGYKRCVFYEHLGRFSFQPRSENFLLGPSTKTLRNLGGLNRNLVVSKGEIYRFLTCMWLHANVVHLLTNTLAILFMGVKLEEDYGFLRIGVLYMLSGFGASLLSCLHQDGSQESLAISVGASGALFGLLGASLSEIITNWTLYIHKCAAITTLIIVIGLNLAIGFIPGIDNMAHIGGFVAGFLLGFVLLLRPQYGYDSGPYIAAGYELKKRKPKYQCHQQLFLIVSLAIIILGSSYRFSLNTSSGKRYFVGFKMLYKGERVDSPFPSIDITQGMPSFGITKEPFNMTQQYNNALTNLPIN